MLASNFNSYAEMQIKVNIPSYELKVYDEANEIARFDIRVGKKETPTPIGKGEIKERRERIVFRYSEGPKKGEIIKYSYLNPEKRTIKMPYNKMRGLQMVIKHDKNLDDGKVIHSTTDYWTVGFPVSHGCIGLKIDDMLNLYNLVNKVPVPVNIGYETIFVEGNQAVFYADIYNKGTNSLERLVNKGIKIRDFESAQRKLNEINKELTNNLKKAKKELSKGKNPGELKNKMCCRVDIGEFLR